MTGPPSLAQALDTLARTAAEAPDDRWTLTVLARAVTELEHAAGSSPGGTEHDPLLELQRRLGRVHGRLRASTTTETAKVLGHLRAPAREPAPGPVAPSSRKPRVGEPA